MSRKTTEVAALITYANNELAAVFPTASTDRRMGVISMVERILSDSDNYNGYRYLDNNEVEGDLPGIREGNRDNQFDNTDDTRRHYF